MTRHHQASGLCRGIEFLIDPGWSPEQAFAVVELLDDLRNRIWAHYAIALSEEYRNQSTRRKTVSIAANLLRHLAPPDSYGNSSPATSGDQQHVCKLESWRVKRKAPQCLERCGALYVGEPGGDLLSHTVGALSSARLRFTVLFEMGRGGSEVLWPPSVTCPYR